MNWYDFGRNDVYTGTGGRFSRADCKRISAEDKARIEDLFSTHLLKISFGEERSYDNSDDERVTDSHSSYSSYVYRELDLEQDLYAVAMQNGEIVGVVFYVWKGNDESANVFYFSGKPKCSMTLGYSASHSSSYTRVSRVELVKKGENGAPDSAKKARFIQHELYPEI